MNKKTLSLTLLSAALLLSGCGNSAKTKPVIEDGKYVLFTIDGTNYYADDILGTDSDVSDLSFIKTTAGIQAAYRVIRNAVIQAAQPVTTTIQNSADLAYDAWEENVKTVSSSYNISIKEARAYLLEQEGYESIDEKKAALLLTEQETALTKSYKKNKIEPSLANLTGTTPLEKYVANATPMIVNHILVKLDSSNNVYSKAELSQTEAEKLGTICNRLALSNKSSNKFASIAYNSDDGSYTTGGSLGIMDTYTGFVNEFKFGVYTAETVLNNNSNNFRNALGISASANDELFGEDGIYQAGQINKISVNEVCSTLVSKSTDIGTQVAGATEDDTSLYVRNQYFNKYFNTPAAQFLTYTDGASETDYPLAERSLNSDGIVTDESGNPIIVVRSTYGIHFITVGYNPLDHSVEENIKYFSYISTDSAINASNNYVKQEDYAGYDDLAAAMTARKEEVDSRVLNYLQGGYVGITPNANYLNYEIFEYYLNSTGIEIPNSTIKKAVLGYVDNLQGALSSTIEAYEGQSWSDYIDLLNYDKSMRDEIYK